jgi:predicted ATPase
MRTKAQIARLVITGAPGSAKTEFFERLKHESEFAEFHFFDELARQLLEEDPSYRNRWGEFHREIYRRQVSREDAVRGESFVSDRGTVDAFAFHPETAEDLDTTIDDEYRRYTGVVQLQTSAALGPDAYQNDTIRQESADTAMEIERYLTKAWQDHPGYVFIAASHELEKKYEEFLAAMKRVAGF